MLLFFKYYVVKYFTASNEFLVYYVLSCKAMLADFLFPCMPNLVRRRNKGRFHSNKQYPILHRKPILFERLTRLFTNKNHPLVINFMKI